MDKKPWSGRFSKKLDPRVEKFNASISFDQQLYREDIEGSLAHAKMLGRQKLISIEETETIVTGLNEVLKDIETGKISFSIECEDIHTNIEMLLGEKIGVLAKKLHTARSRNDQVALDIRLYLRKEIKKINGLIENVVSILKKICNEHQETYMPGYTHLQRAQPVTLNLHLDTYVQMLKRDQDRLNDCYKRMNQSPLGAGSLAGTTLGTDREWVAKELGFDAIVSNPMDAVSDRDFSIEFLSAGAILSMHLSRLSEEIIIWASGEYGFIKLDDAFSTGSSLMPQKKNPDVAELIRGKTGRMYGHLMALLTIMKGLPLAYNKDMQEDKEPIFDAVKTLTECLSILGPFMESIVFEKEKMLSAAKNSFICATELVDYLVEREVKFRDAHEIVGKLIHYCIENKRYLHELDLKVFKDFSEIFNEDVFSYIDLKHAIKKRRLNY